MSEQTELSLAERMYRQSRGLPLPGTESTDSTEAIPQESVDEVYERVAHVLAGLRSLLPPGMQGTRQVAVLTEIMRGMERDISLVPADEVKGFMRAISEATAWIADGSMADLEDIEEDAGLSEDPA